MQLVEEYRHEFVSELGSHPRRSLCGPLLPPADPSLEKQGRHRRPRTVPGRGLPRIPSASILGTQMDAMGSQNNDSSGSLPVVVRSVRFSLLPPRLPDGGRRGNSARYQRCRHVRRPALEVADVARFSETGE